MRGKSIVSFTFLFLLTLTLTSCAHKEMVDDGGSTIDYMKVGNFADENQILRLSQSAEIPTMDSAKASDSIAFTMLNQVMEGLLRLDKDNNLTTGMAKTYKISDDGKTYIFHLRDALWSNGEPVTANDFVYAWRRVVDPKTASQYAFILSPVKHAAEIMSGQLPKEKLGITAINEKTLKVELERATNYFLSLTTFPTFYPLHKQFVEKQGSDYALEADKMLYNGPFVMTAWKHDVGWQVEKNENYWDKQKVKLDKIIWTVVKEKSTEVNLFETEELNRVVLSGDFITKYASDERFVSFQEPTVYWFKFNHADPILKNVNIRRALAMSFNKRGITDIILNNGSRPIGTFIPWGFAKHPKTGDDFNLHVEHALKYDPEKAKKLWTIGLNQLGQKEAEIELLGGDDDTSSLMLEYYKNQFETNLPGLHVTLKTLPAKARLALDEKIDYQMQISGWGPDYLDPLTFADLWVTGGGHNKANYSNKKYDMLVTQAMTEYANKPILRFETLQEAVQLAINDVVVAPIYQRGFAMLLDTKVKDQVVHPFGPDYSFKWAYIAE